MPFSVVLIYIALMGFIFIAQPLSLSQVEAFCDGFITLFCFFGAFNLYRVAYRFEKNDPARITWLLFALGLFCEGVGYLVYFLYEVLLNLYLTFPQVADLSIMAGLICYIISFRIFKIQINQLEAFQSSFRNGIANGLFLIFVALNLVFISTHTLSNPATPLWFRLVFLIYPIFDMCLAYFCLHLALAFLSMGRSPIARPWFVLVGAFGLLFVTDSLFAYINLQGLYNPYSLILPLKGFAYLLISYASHLQLKFIRNIDAFEVSEPLWQNEDETD